ncbi:ATP-binding cassette domain-containing protein [Haploplasma axanthum]|nr:ATP-binding cassette domain-containing protein [Haploplasma axanthum]
MIKLTNVSKGYFKNGKYEYVLDDINLEINSCGLITLLGENGSGKTTLLKIIAKKIDMSRGEYDINFTDENVTDSKLITYMGHEYNYIDHLTVFENVYESMLINKGASFKIDEVNDYLKITNLFNEKDTKASNLSEGEKQRLSIIRTVIKDSYVYIYDEPTSKLNLENIKIIKDLIVKQAKKKIVIIATHEKLFLDESDRIIKLANGKIVSDEQKIKSNNTISVNENRTENEVNLVIKTILKTDLLRKPSNLFPKFFYTLLVLVITLLAILNFNYNKIYYGNYFDNYVEVARKDGKEFSSNEYEKFSNNKYIENVYVNEIIYYVEDYASNSQKLVNVYSSSNFKTDDLIIGRLPKNANEIVLTSEYLKYYQLHTNDFYYQSNIKNMKVIGISNEYNIVSKEKFIELIGNSMFKKNGIRIKGNGFDKTYISIINFLKFNEELKEDEYIINIGNEMEESSEFLKNLNDENKVFLAKTNTEVIFEIDPIVKHVSGSLASVEINYKTFEKIISQYKDEFSIKYNDYSSDLIRLKINKYSDFLKLENSIGNDYVFLTNNHILNERYKDNYFDILVFITLFLCFIYLNLKIYLRIITKKELKNIEKRIENGLNSNLINLINMIKNTIVFIASLIFSILCVYIIKIFFPYLSAYFKVSQFWVLISIFFSIIVLKMFLSIKIFSKKEKNGGSTI